MPNGIKCRKGMLFQDNMNDFVNAYAATVYFSKPFIDLNYMVFANSVMSEALDDENGQSKCLVPSPNDIIVCDKTRLSITFLNILYPRQDKFSVSGFNAKHCGLGANSFHCKVIGRTGG